MLNLVKSPVSTLVPEFITKRDGSIQEFNPMRIKEAVKRAADSVEFHLSETDLVRVTSVVVSRLSYKVTVEVVQDVVEEVLSSLGYFKVARAYLLYREKRRFIRELSDSLSVNLIDSYLMKRDWKIKENANMSYSLQGLNNYVFSEITKKYWGERVYSQDIRDAHENGDFHIHDLGLLAGYCVGWDLSDLLREGFRGVSGKVESSPPNHFRSALGQVTNFFYTLQGETAGAQALSSVDTLLAPFIAKDGLDFVSVKQAIQEWVYNLNVSTRVGFQTPFTNITLDVIVPQRMKNEAVVIGGEVQDSVYGDYQNEMDLFNRAFLEVMSEGDAKGRVFTFPIPTYNVTSDFDYDHPRYDKLWEVTAKYGIPYFANFVNSDLSPDDTRSMCCRLRLDTRDLQYRGGGLFGANPLTGSIGVVTINLPRLGYLSANLEDFFSRLESLLGKARDSLMTKRKVLEQFTEEGLYPYTRFYLRGIKERTGHYWSNHFSTIGLVGLNEAVGYLVKSSVVEVNGRHLGLTILERIRSIILGYQALTGVLFNLEATPAEGTSYRLAKLDRERHPGMRAPLLYTNSSLPPVGYTSDPFELLSNQDDFQTKYTGGTVLHFWLGEKVSDPSLVKKFVQLVCTNYRLPYFTVTPTFSICPNHGYLPGEVSECPTCSATTEVYSRVVGYLRPVSQWNEGKQEEFKNRDLFGEFFR